MVAMDSGLLASLGPGMTVLAAFNPLRPVLGDPRL